jgi:quercetin dioxygenase-like cupin family protein
MPFTITDWSQLPATEDAGESGTATSRTFSVDGLRVRLIRFSPGYIADHWCDRGHIVYVVEGELAIELRDGPTHRLEAGMSFQVSDFGDSAHMLRTETGATVFVVD